MPPPSQREPFSELPQLHRLSTAWAEFRAAFPTIFDCFSELCRIGVRDGAIRCHHCENGDIVVEGGQRTFQCYQCGKTSWATAGTFFHGIRRPDAWLGAIWLLDRQCEFSIKAFESLANVSYSTAWDIFKKLNIVVEEHIDERAVVTAATQFIPVVFRRSKNTPSHAHPRDEYAACEKQQSLPTADEIIDGSDLSPLEAEVLRLFSWQPITFDELCYQSGLTAREINAALTMLELQNCIVQVSSNAFTLRSVKRPADKELLQSENVVDLIKSAVRFVRRTCHGVSAKHLQNFLAGFWFRFDKSSWPGGKLLTACFAVGAIAAERIEQRESRQDVRLVPCVV